MGCCYTLDYTPKAIASEKSRENKQAKVSKMGREKGRVRNVRNIAFLSGGLLRLLTLWTATKQRWTRLADSRLFLGWKMFFPRSISLLSCTVNG